MKQWIVALALVIGACKPRHVQSVVVVVATPHVSETGLARALADAFQHQTHVPVDVRTVAAQHVIAAADSRSGAVAIYRDPLLDDELRKRRALRLRSVFAVEDYVIVGPQRDPARVAKTTNVVDAMKAIVARRRVFCSPVDLPVLLAVEREVWTTGDIEKPGGKLYRPCHGNASEVLAQADRLNAYTITDRATAELRLPVKSRVLLRGGPILHNEYVIALLEYDEARRNRNAEWMMEWAMSYRGRDAVQTLRSPTLPRLYLPDGH